MSTACKLADEATLLALAKAINPKQLAAARDFVDEGSEIDIDAVVHLRGVLEVGYGTETHQVNKLEPMKLFLVALSKLNRTTIDQIVREAERMKDAEFKVRKMEVEHALRRLRGTVKQRRVGPVSFHGTAETL